MFKRRATQHQASCETFVHDDRVEGGVIMTRAIPITKADLKRRIDAAHAAGLFVTGILPDGTVLTAQRQPELIAIQPPAGTTLH
jgi:hypothetical protein